MFSVLKVRKDQAAGNYQDPGWFQHPEGSVAYEYTGVLKEAPSQKVATKTQQPQTPLVKAIKPKPAPEKH